MFVCARCQRLQPSPHGWPNPPTIYVTADGKFVCSECVAFPCPSCFRPMQVLFGIRCARSQQSSSRSYPESMMSVFGKNGAGIRFSCRVCGLQGNSSLACLAWPEDLPLGEPYDEQFAVYAQALLTQLQSSDGCKSVCEESGIGYVTGKWYLVTVDYSGASVPAKFLGLRAGVHVRDHYYPTFPCPGTAVFDHVKPGGCGFCPAGPSEEEPGWGSCRRVYTRFAPAYPEVSVSEQWQVAAIERFYEVLRGRQESFRVSLPDGMVFEGKIKPPRPSERRPGRYFVRVRRLDTGKEFEGVFDFESNSLLDTPQSAVLREGKKRGIPSESILILICRPTTSKRASSRKVAPAEEKEDTT